MIFSELKEAHPAVKSRHAAQALKCQEIIRLLDGFTFLECFGILETVKAILAKSGPEQLAVKSTAQAEFDEILREIREAFQGLAR